MRYDLALFLSLNEEYRDKPIAPQPPSTDPVERARRASKRAAKLASSFELRRKRVLEIGCGRGEMLRELRISHGCTVVGADVRRYPQWDEIEGCTLIQGDLSDPEVARDIGTFDFIYSNSVWEHIRHPFAMLKRARALLAPDGVMRLSANLYRGPKASHRYREVFFPWPHLLFTDEVFEQFYESLGRKPARAAWVNRLSIADYLRYFELAGFEVENLSFSITPIDEPFYRRFADILERYPRYDLERDFLHATLRPAGGRPGRRRSTWRDDAKRLAVRVHRRLQRLTRPG